MTVKIEDVVMKGVLARTRKALATLKVKGRPSKAEKPQVKTRKR